MSAYYLNIRMLHIACAYASIALFVVRHVLNLRGIPWRRSRALRIMPHVVDTVLLGSAVALMFITHQYPIANGWLTMKVAALIVYIGLGIVALKPADPPSSRRAAFLGAAAVFAFILSVARSKSPLGIFSLF
jgi:uncharacterized membrane protein SirB2